MLYDPKWDQQTKADPFSLESLIAWLERQPADKEYQFCQWHNCLLAQWLRTIDPEASVSAGAVTGFFYTVLGRQVDLSHLSDIAHGGDYRAISGHTFGAALERARAALAAV